MWWRSWLRRCATSGFLYWCGHWIDLFLQPQYTLVYSSAFNMSGYQEYLVGRAYSRCVELIILPPSCADCLEILGSPDFCKSTGPFGSVRGFQGRFIRTQDIMDLINVKRKYATRRKIKSFTSINVLSMKILLCKKIMDILISHPETSLRINHPEKIKWMSQIPFIFFINFEHVI